ncbi:DUF4331 domain-containing protein [Sabulilitoribacter multivorans]|uniref:DUF4331 domain-containing protein n=1 Tax=Flaviramulus multivorans TaxID=1304750 RepID=A0ABS9IIA6_9FLAO|nr:DUF4331 family protein [Flaviramulus multivorans]MCF7560491.1 DUF4331 domain-containing protein [Flaviramulus multivorans]
MKTLKYILGIVAVATLFLSCENENYNDDEASLLTVNKSYQFKNNKDNPFINTTWVQEDQMGRPAINTVLVSTGSKDDFNVTIPSEQGALFQSMFQSNLMALSPAFNNPTDTNALGFTAEQFTTALATDVLTVSMVGATTFFDGTNVLTGRALADDVITVELILIFGGEEGLTNPEFPQFSDDNVDKNDKEFLGSFPYLASPW